jgi:hypothetical protein
MDGAAQSRPALLLPGYGDRCGKCWYCSPETPCYCCLQAEVEALREKVKQHEVVFKVQAEALKSTREQVQRVRDAIQVADDRSRPAATFCDDSDEAVERYWGCLEDCSEADPCKCCLAAEVEALRAERDRFANQLVVRVAHWKDATND